MNKKLLCLSLTGIIGMCLGINNTSIIKHVAYAEEVTSTSLTMENGASIRLKDTYQGAGIRFSAKISSEEYESLIQNNTEGSKTIFGMLIAPKTYVDANPLNYENVFSDNAVYDYSVDGIYSGNKTRIVNLTYETLPLVNSEYTIYGSLTNIHLENINAEFVGRAYYKDVNGNYVFAKYYDDNIDNNVRSVKNVASNLVEGDTLSLEQKNWLTRYYINRNQVTNQGFESGLDGWEINKTSNDGRTFANEESSYFTDLTEYLIDDIFYLNFDKTGEKFLCTDDAFTGSIKSSVFTLGGDGIISFKFGAAKSSSSYVKVCKEDGTEIAHVDNSMFFMDPISAQVMLRRYLHLEDYIGQKLYIEIVDGASSDFGFVTFDDLRISMTKYDETNLVNEDIKYSNEFYSKMNVNDNSKQKLLKNFMIDYYKNILTENSYSEDSYQVYNGDFEYGSLVGWSLVSGEVPGIVTSDSIYWNDSNRVFNKDGNYCFTGCETSMPNYEGRIGTIRSKTFTLKANAWVSFKLAGAKNDTTTIRFVDENGTILAKFKNDHFEDAKLKQYIYQFNNSEEIKCHVELVDEATDDWGLLVVDSIYTDYNEMPTFDEECFTAVNIA